MKWVKLLSAYLIILFINVLLTGFLEITIKRPVIYYEYIILPAVFIFISNRFFKVSILLGVILLDIIYNVSHLYYFDIFNYVEKLPYLLIAEFELKFWMGLLLGIILLVAICYWLIKLFDAYFIINHPANKRIFLILSLAIFIIVYVVDSLNGSTLIGEKDHSSRVIKISTKNKREYNLGKSLIRDIYKDFEFYHRGEKQVHELQDFKNFSGDSSLTYKYFYNSNSNKEVVIVLESWGVYLTDSLLQYQMNHFKGLDSNTFQYTCFKSNFDGATLQAESRELLNKEGEAYFSVIKNNNCDIKSIVQHKIDQNYTTLAVQGFDGAFSLGEKFKKLIGFQTFRDYKYFHDSLGKPTLFNNQYRSVMDEDVFTYLFDNIKNTNKNFTYCLTINTHLPFRLTRKQRHTAAYFNFIEHFEKCFPDQEVLDRYYRMHQELEALVKIINKSDVDKVLIVGDHCPPYIFKVERDLFNQKLVPAVLIERKNIN